MKKKLVASLQLFALTLLLVWGGSVAAIDGASLAESNLMGPCDVAPQLCDDWNGGSCEGDCVGADFCCTRNGT